MMMRKYYRFGGLELLVEIPESCAYREEWHLSPFRVDAADDPHRFHFEYVDELTEPAGKCYVKQPNFRLYSLPSGHIRYIGGEHAYICAEHTGKLHWVQVKRNPYTDVIGVKIVLESLEIEHLIARNYGFVFHCSYIDYNGKAILFTAPSETGKSTQAELWHQHRGAQIINGDRAAVRLVDDVLMAEGIPFAGSSGYCKNRSLPIAAIVHLEQAPRTSIRKLRGYEAFSKIWEGVSVNTWEKEDMELVSGVVQKVAEKIPIYHLPCTPDESAVIALEEALRKQVSL